MSIANGNPSTAASDASANPGAADLHLVSNENLSRDLVPSQGWAPSGTRPDSAVAVYWDFENVHACVMDKLQGPGAYKRSRDQRQVQESLVDIGPVVEYAATFGRIAVHRAYCNWQRFFRYSSKLQANAVELVQLFPLNGFKNAADIRLVLDVAEDLQRYPHLTHVVIVATDIDYTPLVHWCRRQGRRFIGVGAKPTESSYTCYKPACDEFRLYWDLAAASAPPASSEAGEAAR
jgi:uncharacterized LabA/DUF88 family protein